MTHVLFEAAAARLLRVEAREMDTNLPQWARRTNPIVRRELGIYWKQMGIEVGSLVRLILLQGVVILFSLIFPFLFMLLMPAATVSIVLLPIAFGLYVHTLVHIARRGAEAMANENRNGTLDLLRVAPRSAYQILLSKGAAALWRSIENLNTVILAATLFSLPLLIIQYDALFHTEDRPLEMRLALMLSLIVSVVRLPIEAGLAAALGLLAGSATHSRAAAITSALLLLAAYFVLVNGVRFLPMLPGVRLLVETLLPLGVAAAGILLSLRAARLLIERD